MTLVFCSCEYSKYVVDLYQICNISSVIIKRVCLLQVSPCKRTHTQSKLDKLHSHKHLQYNNMQNHGSRDCIVFCLSNRRKVCDAKCIFHPAVGPEETQLSSSGVTLSRKYEGVSMGMLL